EGFAFAERFLRRYAVVDVGAGGEPFGDDTVVSAIGNAADEAPAIGAVLMEQAYLRFERAAAAQAFPPQRAGSLDVERTHHVEPAEAEAVAVRTAGELVPLRAEIGASPLAIALPDDLRDRIEHVVGARIALAQRRLGLLALGQPLLPVALLAARACEQEEQEHRAPES